MHEKPIVFNETEIDLSNHYTVDEIVRISGRNPRVFQNRCLDGTFKKAIKVKNKVWHIHIDDLKEHYPEVVALMALNLEVKGIEEYVQNRINTLHQRKEMEEKTLEEMKKKGDNSVYLHEEILKSEGQLVALLDIQKQINAWMRVPGWDRKKIAQWHNDSTISPDELKKQLQAKNWYDAYRVYYKSNARC